VLVEEVPPGVTKVTSMVPAEAAGAVAVMDVGELTVKVAAAFPPKRTADALLRFVPVIVTLVPPATGPATGLTPVTVSGLW
jgi:hypothetical protein